HQANLRINEHVQKLMEIPDEKIFHNIQRYGNTTAGTIPILLAEAERAGKLERGMKVACTAFGSGFTWGSAIIDW
ncbi:MAG: 3-oxoacyl-ACP synthase, partial [Myxococcales bacterium]|nr:3-oxoacyl-ACP synthase [Myxococcales bacterium]